jgi:hypothetical protein
MNLGTIKLSPQEDPDDYHVGTCKQKFRETVIGSTLKYGEKNLK